MAVKRILFYIYTPAQAHTWSCVIRDLIKMGHEVKIIARDYGSTVDILSQKGFQVSSFKPIALKFKRHFEIFTALKKGYKISHQFQTTLIVGFGMIPALQAHSSENQVLLLWIVSQYQYSIS